MRAARFFPQLAWLIAVVLTLGLLTTVGVANADPLGCSAQQQALDSVNAAIAQHNAQPHDFIVPDQQAAADAYNAEAAQLNARGDAAEANLNGCVRVTTKLADGGTLPKPTPSKVDKINAGKSRLPPGYVPPAPPPRSPSGGITVAPEMKPLFDQIREKKKWPDDMQLQGKAKPAVGDPDPARNGTPIPGMASDPSRPMVVVDHIVPLAQLMYVPGFLKLPADYMYMVANAPLNLQWMSAYGNAAKSSDSVARISGADQQWLKEQLQLEQDTQKKLQDLINQLLATLPPG